MMTHSSRQPLTKVHCKVPYRTYERRPAPSWTRRIQQQSEEVSDDEADDDDDDSDGSDGSPPILTKAHAMLAAKRKVTFVVCGCESCFLCFTPCQLFFFPPGGIISLIMWNFILGRSGIECISLNIFLH